MLFLKKINQLLDRELSSDMAAKNAGSEELVKAQNTANRLKAMELAKELTPDEIQKMKDNAELLLQ